MTITITVENDDLPAIAARMMEFDDLAVAAGLLEPEEALIGYRHELGKGMPMRPFMGPATDGARERIGAKAQREIGNVVDGTTTAGLALTATGEVAIEAQLRYVESGQVKGKDLSDQAKTRDPRKLIHSGTMIGSLDTEITTASEVDQ